MLYIWLWRNSRKNQAVSKKIWKRIRNSWMDFWDGNTNKNKKPKGRTHWGKKIFIRNIHKNESLVVKIKKIYWLCRHLLESSIIKSLHPKKGHPRWLFSFIFWLIRIYTYIHIHDSPDNYHHDDQDYLSTRIGYLSWKIKTQQPLRKSGRFFIRYFIHSIYTNYISQFQFHFFYVLYYYHHHDDQDAYIWADFLMMSVYHQYNPLRYERIFSC